MKLTWAIFFLTKTIYIYIYIIHLWIFFSELYELSVGIGGWRTSGTVGSIRWTFLHQIAVVEHSNTSNNSRHMIVVVVGIAVVAVSCGQPFAASPRRTFVRRHIAVRRSPCRFVACYGVGRRAVGCRPAGGRAWKSEQVPPVARARSYEDSPDRWTRMWTRPRRRFQCVRRVRVPSSSCCARVRVPHQWLAKILHGSPPLPTKSLPTHGHVLPFTSGVRWRARYRARPQ